MSPGRKAEIPLTGFLWMPTTLSTMAIGCGYLLAPSFLSSSGFTALKATERNMTNLENMSGITCQL